MDGISIARYDALFSIYIMFAMVASWLLARRDEKAFHAMWKETSSIEQHRGGGGF